MIYALDVSGLSGLLGRQKDVADNLYQFSGRLAAAPHVRRSDPVLELATAQQIIEMALDHARWQNERPRA